MRVKDVMQTDLFTLHEDDTIQDASSIMKFEKIRHIPIVNDDYKLVGLVTYKELIASLAQKSVTISIKDIMRKEVKALEPDTPLKGAIEVMIMNKIDCIPVIDNHRKLIGIITEIDLLKFLYDIVKMPDDFYTQTPKA